MIVADGIELIDGTVANAYLAEISGHYILVDCGTPGTGRKIVKFLENKKIRPETVLITHYHPDHIGGLYKIYTEYRPEIFVPDGELNIINGRSGPENSRVLPKFFAFLLRSPEVSDINPVSSMRIDGISHISTPGHTIDSTSYAISGGILFSGDAAVNRHGK
ncbi:MAG: MBL fold metallo-hydrolase, partial [Ferroplasma sp.]